jgi:hypothetical protein
MPYSFVLEVAGIRKALVNSLQSSKLALLNADLGPGSR